MHFPKRCFLLQEAVPTCRSGSKSDNNESQTDAIMGIAMHDVESMHESQTESVHDSQDKSVCGSGEASGYDSGDESGYDSGDESDVASEDEALPKSAESRAEVGKEATYPQAASQQSSPSSAHCALLASVLCCALGELSSTYYVQKLLTIHCRKQACSYTG